MVLCRPSTAWALGGPGLQWGEWYKELWAGCQDVTLGGLKMAMWGSSIEETESLPTELWGKPMKKWSLILNLENCAFGFVWWSNLRIVGGNTPENWSQLHQISSSWKSLFSLQKICKLCSWQLIFEEERGVCVFSLMLLHDLCVLPSENQDQDDGRVSIFSSSSQIHFLVETNRGSNQEWQCNSIVRC